MGPSASDVITEQSTAAETSAAPITRPSDPDQDADRRESNSPATQTRQEERPAATLAGRQTAPHSSAPSSALTTASHDAAPVRTRSRVVATDEGPVAGRGTKRSTRQTVPSDHEPDVAEAAVDGPAEVPPNDSALPSASVRPHRRREKTPEDAEAMSIDPKAMRMGDLTRDLRQGRKSSKYAEFKKIAAARRRRRATQVDTDQNPGSNGMGGAEESRAAAPDSQPAGTSGTSTHATENQIVEPRDSSDDGGESDDNDEGEDDDDEDDNDDDDDDADNLPLANSVGPQLRLVNGKLVVDQTTLHVDRFANSARRNANEVVQYVEENPLEKRLNSSTYAKKTTTDRWDEGSTEAFYNALSQWGTDFEMISQLFPTRTRRQIKAKFVIEERRNGPRITATLKKPKAINLEDYTVAANIEVPPVADLERELQELKDAYEKETLDARAKVEEMKREEMQRAADDADEQERPEDEAGEAGTVGAATSASTLAVVENAAPPPPVNPTTTLAGRKTKKPAANGRPDEEVLGSVELYNAAEDERLRREMMSSSEEESDDD